MPTSAALADPPQRAPPTCPPSPRSTPGNVLHGTGTFELEPPDQAEMARRRDDVLAKGLPWLVAERGGTGAGLRLRQPLPAAPGLPLLPRGLDLPAPTRRAARAWAALLLAELLARCEAAGARQMLAVIGDSANAGSIGVHRALGFEHAGVLRAAGWKFDRWLDVVLMQKALGPGDASAPADSAVSERPVQVQDPGHLACPGRRRLGLHRFYLHGLRDLLGLAATVPTLLGPVRRAARARTGPGRPPAGC